MLLLEDFYIIQSPEILHEFHNVPLKNALSMMTATRRKYIQCFSTSCVICRHVTMFSENYPNEWRNYLTMCLSIICCIFSTNCRPHDRRRKAYRLSQMIKRSFQYTAFFLWPVNSPSSKDVHSRTLYRNLNLQLHPTTLFPKVSRGPMVAHSPLFEFKRPHISKFSWSWVKRRKNNNKV